MTPTRTVTLTERTPRVVRLAPDDVTFLLARHPTHLALAPTGRRHTYTVTPAGVAGAIVAPHTRLVIRPKIPLANVFFLLEPDAQLPPPDDATTPAEASALLDFLAGRLARRLAERAAAGLHRGYAERADAGPVLLGRLDVAAQARAAPGRKDVLHSRYDELTPDVPCNRVPRAVAERLLGCPLLGGGPRDALARALPAFAAVRPLPPTPEALARLAAERLPAGYQEIVDLCRVFADGLGPGEEAGPAPAPAFLLEMERVFERFVTRGVAEAFQGEGWSVSAQPTHAVNRPAPGQPDVRMRPDVTVGATGRVALVLDVKWKRLPKAALVTEDLYQVLAYCAALGADRGVLVYPGRRERAWEYEFAATPARVTVRTLNVAGSPAACARSLRRLGKALRGMLA